MQNITLLTHIDRMTLFYSGYPLMSNGIWSRVSIFDSIKDALASRNNDVAIVIRYFRFRKSNSEERDVEVEKIKKLRNKYSQVIFFDDADGAGDTRFEVMPFVDKYLKKQTFKSFENYKRRLYGRQLFTEYYHKKYNVTDKRKRTRIPLNTDVDSSKIEVSWNLGAGRYPIHPNLQRIGTAIVLVLGKTGVIWRYKKPKTKYISFSKKDPFIHAHFDCEGKDRTTVDFQRKIFFERINEEKEFKTGVVSKRRYDKNISKSMITLSPFGWGEICFRDFEAILHGSALMKPNMDHLDTWPNVYIPYETYIPVSWDGDDVVPKAHEYLSKPEECARIAENAREVWRNSLSNLEERVKSLIYP